MFLSTHSLFAHQKEFQLSLLPLHLLLQKLQGLARSSLKQYFDIMLREFHILGLMYSVLSELPKSDRILDSEDVLLDEAGILRWMTELEVSMSSLRDLTEQTPATIVQTLISRGQFVLCRRLVEVLRFDGEMVASTLAKWVADQLRASRPEKLEKLEVPIRRNGETYAKGSFLHARVAGGESRGNPAAIRGQSAGRADGERELRVFRGGGGVAGPGKAGRSVPIAVCSDGETVGVGVALAGGAGEVLLCEGGGVGEAVGVDEAEGEV